MIHAQQMHQWNNPRQKIWGFHIHQELPIEDFAKALVIQKQCAAYLTQHSIPIDVTEAFKPGYGPHLNYVWELRIESANENVLEKLGLAVSFMAINRFGFSAYIHPLMHSRSLTGKEALKHEGLENETNALWFSATVPQHQDFFFNPPLDQHQNIMDTRTSRILTAKEKIELYETGRKQLYPQAFQQPANIIIRGFHIQMDYKLHQTKLALALYEQFLMYLHSEKMQPTSTYSSGRWEISLETRDQNRLEKIGVAIGWLMCNRQELPVWMYPITWEEGDHDEKLKAQQDYTFFIP